MNNQDNQDNQENKESEKIVYEHIRSYTKPITDKETGKETSEMEIQVDKCPIHGEFEYPKFGIFTFSTCPKCCEEKENQRLLSEEKRIANTRLAMEIKKNERMKDPDVLDRMGIKKRYHAARFDAWVPEAEEPKRTLQEAAKIGVIEAAKRKSGTVLLLGGHGTRKTTLVCAAMRFLGEGYLTTMFECSFRLHSNDNNRDDDMMATGFRFLRFLKTFPVVCFDEVGMTSCSDFDVQWFSDVINERDAAKLLTFIIGNYPTKRLAPSGYKGITFDQMVGPAVMSRLNHAEVYRISGTDFRSLEMGDRQEVN